MFQFDNVAGFSFYFKPAAGGAAGTFDPARASRSQPTSWPVRIALVHVDFLKSYSRILPPAGLLLLVLDFAFFPEDIVLIGELSKKI